jgi:nucleoside-diphosphate-sugar epimerase
VAITGATGMIGRVLSRGLADEYELRLLTRREAGFPSVVVDLGDLESVTNALDGASAVLHLAAASTVESPWKEVLEANLVGAYTVFEASRRAGVDLVVFASSNHAIGTYEVENAPALYTLDNELCWDENVEVRPDSLYGASKVFGEALGRYYADVHGLRVLCLRIGSVLADDDPRSDRVEAGPSWMSLGPEDALARLRATWMSQRDCIQLFRRCLEAVELRWAVVYGISDNPRQFWDLRSARRLLGYRPADAAPVEASSS